MHCTAFSRVKWGLFAWGNVEIVSSVGILYKQLVSRTSRHRYFMTHVIASNLHFCNLTLKKMLSEMEKVADPQRELMREASACEGKGIESNE